MKTKIKIGIVATLLIIISIKVQAQQTLDGTIKNNSLAVSPNENIAVASNSDTPLESLRENLDPLPGDFKMKNPRNRFNYKGFLWGLKDSNLRPSACKADALNQLS